MMMKKAQQLVLGTTIMLFVFFLAIVLFTNYLLQTPKIDSERYEFVQSQAQRAAATITTSGYPLHWSSTNVQRIGLMTNNLFNRSKFDVLNKLNDTDDGYHAIQQALGITDEYLLKITVPQTPNDDKVYYIGALANVDALIDLDPAYIAHHSRKVIDAQSKGIVTIEVNVYRLRR